MDQIKYGKFSVKTELTHQPFEDFKKLFKGVPEELLKGAWELGQKQKKETPKGK